MPIAAIGGSLSELSMFGCLSRELAATAHEQVQLRRDARRRLQAFGLPLPTPPAVRSVVLFLFKVIFSRRCVTRTVSSRSAIASAIADDCVQEDLGCGR